MTLELSAIVQLDEVLALAKLYPIFPCRRHTEQLETRVLKAKSPLTPSGFKDASQDETTIRSWWQKYPDALVGVPTGSITGLCVVDFDAKFSDPAAQEWLSENQTALVSTRIHATGGGSGGRHYIFKLPQGVEIRGGTSLVLNKRKRQGIDVRSSGGYVIWWALHYGQPAGLNEIQPLPAGLLDERRMDLELPASTMPVSRQATTQEFQGQLSKARDALSYLDPSDYDVWLRIGMALHHASGGAADGLELWDAWSFGGLTGDLPSNYAGRGDIEYRWQSFQLERSGGVTMGSLFSAAKAAGYVMPDPVALRLLTMPEAAPVPVENYADTPEAFGWIRDSLPELPNQLAPETNIILRDLSEIVSERREASWLIHNILEANVLAILAGPRGSFKSFIALDWCMRCAVAGNAVVILSGEGAGLGRRAEAWMLAHGAGAKISSLQIKAVERAINLNAEADLKSLQLAINSAKFRPAIVLIDTLSKFSAGMDENSNAEVAAYLARITEFIREEWQATVLLVAHSGHGDVKRPRGASALMANPDAEYIVTRSNPCEMLVQVSRERFKDTASLPPLSYLAESVDLGRDDFYGERVNSLVLKATETLSAPKTSVPHGKVQRQLLMALRERQKAKEERIIWSLADIRQVARELQIGKAAGYAAAESLALSQFMKSSVGGYLLNAN